MYDLIIIGAGPAGLSAAVYAARKKINTLVLGENIGGQVGEANIVENYLGISSILGTDLIKKFEDHAKKLNVPIRAGATVKTITKTADGFKILTGQDEFAARTIIIASGKKYRRLEIPGAQEFNGKGVTYCATCDAPLFKNKTVAVIGGGDAGQDAAWQLTDYAAKIYLLNKYPDLRGDDVKIQEQIKNHARIEIFNQSEPLEIKGDKFVKSLVFRHNGSAQTKEIAVDGIFVEIGSSPVSRFLDGLIKLNAKEEIIINPQNNMSSQPGLFAAGDVTDVPRKQMIVAAGEGAKAALGAYDYLKQIAS